VRTCRKARPGQQLIEKLDDSSLVGHAAPGHLVGHLQSSSFPLEPRGAASGSRPMPRLARLTRCATLPCGRPSWRRPRGPNQPTIWRPSPGRHRTRRNIAHGGIASCHFEDSPLLAGSEEPLELGSQDRAARTLSQPVCAATQSRSRCRIRSSFSHVPRRNRTDDHDAITLRISSSYAPAIIPCA